MVVRCWGVSIKWSSTVLPCSEVGNKWENKGVAYVPALLVASYRIVSVFSFKQPWLIVHRESVFVDTHPQINQAQKKNEWVLLWLLFFSATNILTMLQISLCKSSSSCLVVTKEWCMIGLRFCVLMQYKGCIYSPPMVLNTIRYKTRQDQPGRRRRATSASTSTNGNSGRSDLVWSIYNRDWFKASVLKLYFPSYPDFLFLPAKIHPFWSCLGARTWTDKDTNNSDSPSVRKRLITINGVISTSPLRFFSSWVCVLTT